MRRTLALVVVLVAGAMACTKFGVDTPAEEDGGVNPVDAGVEPDAADADSASSLEAGRTCTEFAGRNANGFSSFVSGGGTTGSPEEDGLHVSYMQRQESEAVWGKAFAVLPTARRLSVTIEASVKVGSSTTTASAALGSVIRGAPGDTATSPTVVLQLVSGTNGAGLDILLFAMGTQVTQPTQFKNIGAVKPADDLTATLDVHWPTHGSQSATGALSLDSTRTVSSTIAPSSAVPQWGLALGGFAGSSNPGVSIVFKRVCIDVY